MPKQRESRRLETGSAAASCSAVADGVRMVATETANLTGDAAAFAAATAEVPETLGDAPVDAQGQAITGPVVQFAGLSPEILEVTFGTVFDLIANRLGEDGAFWKLQDAEKKTLANVWLPVLNPLWAKWVGEADPGLVLALICTTATLAPRLMRESARRGLQMGSTETGKSGDSFSSPGRPVPVSPQRPTA